MKKILITYPQIIVEQKEIEVDDELCEELTQHMSREEIGSYIYSNLTYLEKDCTMGEKWVAGFVDMGCVGIREVN